MTYLRYLLRRGAFAVLSVYLVVTVTFFLINLTLWAKLGDRLAIARYRGATPRELAQIREGFMSARNIDVPIHERYLGWLIDVSTFEWGYSVAYRRPVIAVLDGRVQATLEYVLPGVVLAVGLGVIFGLVAALARDSVVDWSARGLGYVLLGIPAFVVVYYYQYLSGTGLATLGGFKLVAPRLSPTWLASFTVATSLLAGQVRFSRMAALEQSGRAFVKLLRAKGSSRLGLARHVLRNASLPIVSLSFSELLAVLMLDIYAIEAVLPIRGLAGASLLAARESDIPLVIWTTMVLVFIGITGNFLQDVLYGSLDPRVRSD